MPRGLIDYRNIEVNKTAPSWRPCDDLLVPLSGTEADSTGRVYAAAPGTEPTPLRDTIHRDEVRYWQRTQPYYPDNFLEITPTCAE